MRWNRKKFEIQRTKSRILEIKILTLIFCVWIFEPGVGIDNLSRNIRKMAENNSLLVGHSNTFVTLVLSKFLGSRLQKVSQFYSKYYVSIQRNHITYIYIGHRPLIRFVEKNNFVFLSPIFNEKKLSYIEFLIFFCQKISSFRCSMECFNALNSYNFQCSEIGTPEQCWNGRVHSILVASNNSKLFYYIEEAIEMTYWA